MIESVLPLDASTLLMRNDNNFPSGGGRELAAKNVEFLKIHLAQPLYGRKQGRRHFDIKPDLCGLVEELRGDYRH